MSGRLSSESPSPSPPKSRSSSKRRPLQARSESEINETLPRPNRAGAAGEPDSWRGSRGPADDKVYATSPFPTLESQILRPRLATRSPSAPATHLSPLGIHTPTLYYENDSTTTTPVTLDHGSNSRSYDFTLHDASFHSSSSARTSDLPSFEPGLTTPASTIRLVTDDDTPSTQGDAEEARAHPSTQNRSVYGSGPSTYSYADSPDWPLPLLPRQNADPGTPTPAPRSSRPTIRAISSLASEATARYSPASARSANSSGTQVHRRGRATDDDPPDGSYLQFAERRSRRSTSDPELPSSSPIIRAFHVSSPAESPEATTPSAGRRRDSDFTGQNTSHFSFHRGSGGFPALRRYLDAAEASSRSPSIASNESSPTSGVLPELRPNRQLPRSNALRWSSLMSSLSTVPSQPEGTTAPSSIRVISAEPSNIFTEPSNIFDENETSQLTENTVQSSIRLVSTGQSHLFADADLSALTQDSNVQSSIRLVSPEPSQQQYDADTSVLTFQTQPSIRLVEQSPGESDDGSRYSRSELDETPTARRSYGQGPASSPAWVSYSSPVQLPHIADEEEEEVEEEPESSSSAETSPDLSQLGFSDSAAGTSTSPNAQEVIYPSNSSHVTRMPYRRRSIRQTSSSPFFHGSSGRANLRQSTIGQSPHQDQEEYWDPQRQESQAATSSFNQNPLEPLAESSPTSSASNGSGYSEDEYAESLNESLRFSGPLQFPAASSSIDNTPRSIHIPRNRPYDRVSRIQHIRARTLGSMSGGSSRNPNVFAPKSPRRSSSPPLPYNYPTPATPSDRPARPSNPTPGVTPGATPAHDRRLRPAYQPTLPTIDPASSLEPISYPSVIHRSSHYQLPGRVGNRDFSPHLWHGATNAVNRRSMFRPPSIDEVQFRFLSGAKARRDLQVACFALGFLIPICWIVASFLPLPTRGNVASLPGFGKQWKGKRVIGDLEKVEGYDAFTADEVAGYESARWWRRLNRCLSLLGIGLIAALIVLGVVTSKGGIQV